MHRINLWDPRLKDLSDLAGRIAKAVERFRAKPKDPVVGALDDLLGAVYALVSAVEKDFKGKPGPSDFGAVVTRAQQLADGEVRKDGNWMAGFHFNSALFRISAVFDRLPKSFGGHALARSRYQKKKGKAWDDASAHAVRLEVNRLKHKASGVFGKRRKAFDEAKLAVEQLLDLAEALI